MIPNLLINVGVSFVVLYLGDRLISARIPAFKLVVIAILGQLFVIFGLDYAMHIAGMVPVSRLDLILEAVVWVGIVNFAVPRTEPKEYFILGLLAFGVNHIYGLIGPIL